MSLNGSGIFNVNSTGQPVVSNTVISASVFNAFTADVAVALSNAVYKDGQSTTTASVPFTQGITVGGGNLQVDSNGNLLTSKLVTGQSGMIVSGRNLSAVFRTDAQIEIDNFVAGRHALFAIYQDDKDDEAAVTFGAKLSDNSVTQMIGNFVRFVGGANTWNGTWNSVWGVHNVGGYGSDNQTLLTYANNSVWLATGPTADASWDVLPQDNSVSTGNGTTTNAGIKIVNGLVSGWGGIGAENLTLTTSNYAILIKNDASAMNLNAATGGQVNTCINNSVVWSVQGTGCVLTGSLAVSTGISSYYGTSTPSGGATGQGIYLYSDGPGFIAGSGVPTCGARKGTYYARMDGSTTNNRGYINTDGGTTWTAVITAA